MAQQIRIEKVQAFYDPHATPELFYQLPVGFKFTFSDSSQTKTKGFLHGKVRWHKLHITTKQGQLKKGTLTFDPVEVWKNNHQVTFRVSYRDTTLYCQMALPYLKEIKFNLYTDSIKRNVPYYLNVEGVFSSRKVYPLDTTMLSFRVSSGALEKNIVKISADKNIKKIKVKVRFKLDSTLQDSTTIPVKTYIANPQLPSEKKLLQEWKRGKR